MARLTRSDIAQAQLDAIANFPNLREAAALTRRMVLPKVAGQRAVGVYTPDEQLNFVRKLEERLGELAEDAKGKRAVTNLVNDIKAVSLRQKARQHQVAHATADDPHAGLDDTYYGYLTEAKAAIDALPEGQLKVDHLTQLITFFPAE